jgi:hypothetical protein
MLRTTFNKTAANAEKIIIVIQLLIIIILVIACWTLLKKAVTNEATKVKSFFIRSPIVHQEAVNQEAVNQEAVNQEAVNQEAVNQEAVNQEAVNQEAVNQEVSTQEAFAPTSSEEEVIDSPLNKSQTDYDPASFQDYFEYGLYPQWYADYPNTPNILGDSFGYAWSAYKPNKEGELKQYHSSGQHKTEEINRSTSTWGSDKPTSEFTDNYQYGKYPQWYSNYPSNDMVKVMQGKEKECESCKKPVWYNDNPNTGSVAPIYSKF